AGEVHVIHHHAKRFIHADGGNGKVRAAQPKRGQSYQKRRQRCDDRSSSKAQPWTAAGVDHQSGGVSAQAVKHGKAEGNLAGETTQQVPGKTGGGPESSNKD